MHCSWSPDFVGVECGEDPYFWEAKMFVISESQLQFSEDRVELGRSWHAGPLAILSGNCGAEDSDAAISSGPVKPRPGCRSGAWKSLPLGICASEDLYD